MAKKVLKTEAGFRISKFIHKIHEFNQRDRLYEKKGTTKLRPQLFPLFVVASEFRTKNVPKFLSRYTKNATL